MIHRASATASHVGTLAPMGLGNMLLHKKLHEPKSAQWLLLYAVDPRNQLDTNLAPLKLPNRSKLPSSMQSWLEVGFLLVPGPQNLGS